MAKAELLYEKWKRKCPPEVKVADFEKLIRHYLGPWLREKSGTSHRFIVEHPALSLSPKFGGNNTLSVSLKSGRAVKRVWVEHTLKAIECVEMYERIMNDKERET